MIKMVYFMSSIFYHKFLEIQRLLEKRIPMNREKSVWHYRDMGKKDEK